ncbi:MAG: hypothetical protein KDH09_03520 [Chrysiogenetes bacterium]|nr:hypothetical protein [Chrysiogenetes bacterium]
MSVQASPPLIKSATAAFLIGFMALSLCCCDPGKLVILTGFQVGPGVQLSEAESSKSFQIDVTPGRFDSNFTHLIVEIELDGGEVGAVGEASWPGNEGSSVELGYQGVPITHEISAACDEGSFPEPKPESRTCSVILDVDLLDGSALSGSISVKATLAYYSGVGDVEIREDALDIELTELP